MAEGQAARARNYHRIYELVPVRPPPVPSPRTSMGGGPSSSPPNFRNSAQAFAFPRGFPLPLVPREGTGAHCHRLKCKGGRRLCNDGNVGGADRGEMGCDDSHSRLERACATRLLGASYLFHVFGTCQKRENSSTWTCQKREIERQHKNVAARGIFSMLALRPKRGRKERGEERKRKRGEARISFDLPFRYFYPALCLHLTQ